MIHDLLDKVAEESGWVGCDLDGTLAHYDEWEGSAVIGTPIPPVVDMVRRLLSEGKDVRIMTARMHKDDGTARRAIQKWCKQHLGESLKVTNRKDPGMELLIDDKAVGVETNTGEIKSATTLAQARKDVDTNPSKAQIAAGNYRKGHVHMHGLDISIENPKGSTRKGTDRSGRTWERELTADYGYARGTQGKDGDQVDVFLGPHPESELAVVINQVRPGTRTFDEHKVILGCLTEKEARALYLENYQKGWTGLGSSVVMTVDQLKSWMDQARLGTPCKEVGMNKQAVLERAYQDGYKRAFKAGLAIKALKALRPLAERAAFAGGAYAIQPRVEAGLAGGRAPREGMTNTRLITALTSGLLGPRYFSTGRKALGGASAISAAPVMRGLGERGAKSLGWSGAKLPDNATSTQRLAGSLVGDELVGGTNNAASILGSLGTSDSAKEFGDIVVDRAVVRAREAGKEIGKEVLPGAFKNMGRELGVASLGGVAGYGAGAVLSRRLRAPDPSQLNPADPASVTAFYADYERHKRNKRAIKTLLTSLGGLGSVAILRAIENNN